MVRTKESARCRYCDKPRGPSDEARRARQCDGHFLERQQKKARTVTHRSTQCAREGCPNTIGDNEKYCSNRCKFLDSRIIDDSHVVAVTADPCWRGIQTAARLNPCGIASLNGLDNIVKTLGVYARKARRARYYNIVDDELLCNQTGEPRLRPAIKLAVCHLIANSTGGLNTAINLINGPALINHALRYRIYIPKSEWAKKIFGHRICQQPRCPWPKKSGKGKQQSLSLLEALKTQEGYTDEAIAKTLQKWPLPQHDPGKYRQYTLPEAPLTTLLCDELLSLEYRLFGRIRRRLNTLRKNYTALLEGYMDVIAIAVFVALQTVDRDGLLKLLHQAPVLPLKPEEEAVHFTTNTGHEVIVIYEGGLLYPVAKKAQQIIRRYLDIDEHARLALSAFYRRMFTLPPAIFSPEKIVLVSMKSPRHIAHTSTRPVSFLEKQRQYIEDLNSTHLINVYRKGNDPTFEAIPGGKKAEKLTRTESGTSQHTPTKSEAIDSLFPPRY